MADIEFEQRVAAVRRFGRFYTRQIGALNEGLLKSSFPLTEARVLYELAYHPGPTASGLGRELALDPGYLSRILRSFEERGLLRREPSPRDARQSHLFLTETGEQAFAPLDQASREEVTALLSTLSEADQGRLLEAMQTIETLLGGPPAPQVPYILRPHRPGDLGWVVHRQAVLYSQEYGWNSDFEGLVAQIVADFQRDFDPRREQCWIAEREGLPVGSAFLVQGASEEEAKLRLLYVEASARGLGIGRRLVEECIAFARRCGYRRLTLWTNDILVSARRIYEATGFRLVAEEPHHSFGKDLVGQTWTLDL